MNRLNSAGLLLLLALMSLCPTAAYAGPGSDSAPNLLSANELEDLAEPIALYPDVLLQLVLPASTFPDQIVDAALLIKGPSDADQIKSQKWDPSVKAIANYPGVLKMMFGDLAWTTNLGQAFMNQNRALLDAIQRLRGKAEALGNLESDKGQKVSEKTDPTGNTYITIESKDPDVVYVPASTTTVYEEKDSSSSALVPLATFGLGMALGAAMSDDDDHDHYYYGGGGSIWYGGNSNVDHWMDNRRAAWEDHNDRAWDRQNYRQDSRTDRRNFRQDQIESGNWQAPTQQQRQAAQQKANERRAQATERRSQAQTNASSRAQAARSNYSGGGAFQGYGSSSRTSSASARGSYSRGSSSYSRGSSSFSRGGGGGGARRGGGGGRRR